MAKLVLRRDDGGATEYEIDKDRLTIGRRSDNDVCLTNSAVSAEHAVVVTILNDSFLEDLGSTNGTFVNGKPVKRHFLQNDDLIEIGRHRMTFEVEAPAIGNVAQAPEPVEEVGIVTTPVPVAPSAAPEPVAVDPEAESPAMLVVL